MTKRVRSAASVLLLATSLLTVPALAANQTSKRRSTTPTAGPLVLATISGTVTDAVTGQPVAYAAVGGGRRNTQTDAQGKFELRNAEGFSDVLFDVQRSGYQLFRSKFVGAGPHVINVQLQPTATIAVKRKDGSTFAADYENIRFGFPVVFVGFRASESEEFCFANGTTTKVHKSEIRKITGPGVRTPSACCTTQDALKVTLELKNGQVMDAFFVDSCTTDGNMELIGTNHASGEIFDVPWTDITEAVFP